MELLNDLEQLEGSGAGTWSRLAEAHRDLEAFNTTPGTHVKRYVPILFRFPAAVELFGISPLSEAMICRRRRDSPAVLAERNLL